MNRLQSFIQRNRAPIGLGVVVLLVLALVTLVFAPVDYGPPEAQMPWKPFSLAALDEARVAGKPVLIYFHAEWCGPCKALEGMVLSKKQFVDAAADFVPLQVDATNQDAPEIQKVLQAFAIEAFPTLVFVGRDGNENRLARMVGVDSLEANLNRLQMVNQNRKP
ncbi:MAG TPA: thioredoxin family protein [Roseimicrobium sp.]|nr:thioredoxin family protein [Roseimicrobium sp.]